MDSLLLFFREEVLELWSIDPNGRLIPVNYNSSNKIPLYFLLNGDQIQMDLFAKESYKKSVLNSYGDFWLSNSSNILVYERFGAKYKFDTLLPHTLKESILPSVIKSHFHCGNLSDFLTQFNTLISFDSFVDQEQQEQINKNLLEIVGYNPNSLILVDFWDNYRELLIKDNTITRNDSFVLVNASLGNVYFHLIGKSAPSHLSKKVLSGKGHDPRVDVILDFLSEIARAKGSIVPQSNIKKEIVADAEIILSKLTDGYVMHTIKNDKIGINPLRIGFHRSEIDGRLNNKQSLNFIQNEFDSFRRNNNAENLTIILSGSVINQPVFKEFFSNTYSKVHSEADDFEGKFNLHCLIQNISLTSKVSSEHAVTANSDSVTGVAKQNTVSPPLGGNHIAPVSVPPGSRLESAPPLLGLNRPVLPPTIPASSRSVLPPLPEGNRTVPPVSVPPVARPISAPPLPGMNRPVSPPPIPGSVRSVSPPPLPVGNKNVPPVVPPPQNVQNGTKGDVKPAKNKVNIPPPPPPPPIASNKGTTGNKEKKTTQKKNTVSKVTDSNNLKPKKTQIELILKKFYSNLMVADSQTKSKVFLNGNIHQTKYMNMMNKLGLSIPYSECLFQYDDTLFGAGDNGILITEKYFIWRNLGDSGKYITWNDIVKFSVNGNIKIILHDNTGVIHSIDNGMIRKSLLFAGCFSDILKLYKS
jgi:hypothetical protein